MKNRLILFIAIGVLVLFGISMIMPAAMYAQWPWGKKTTTTKTAPKTTTKSNINIKSQPISGTKVSTPVKATVTTTTTKPTQATTTAAPKPTARPTPVVTPATAPAPTAQAEKEPTDANGYYDRGVRLYYSGKYDAALADFNKAIKMNPNFGEAYCELGVTTMEKGDFKSAIGMLEKSIQLKPDYPKSNYALAVAYSRVDPPDTVKARKYLEEAKKLGYLVPPWFEDFLKRLEEKRGK